jgi:phospholipase D1/2
VDHPERSVLEPDVTFWRRARAQRFGMVVDAGDYYAALASALRQASRQILVLAWDFDTRAPLLVDGATGHKTTFGEILTSCLEENRRLEFHALCWDFALVYAGDRQENPLAEFAPHVVDRVHIEFDGVHPTWGSHHQKVVIVDGRLAFVGGLDIALGRWDTRDHLARDPRRRCPRGKRNIPYHDTMCVVDGEAALALHALARERWMRFCGRAPSAPEEFQGSAHEKPWPEGVEVLVHDVPVAFARTEPGFQGSPRVTEIEELFARVVLSARQALYMETQYFTSAWFAQLLARRLAEPQGPEVLLVVPKSYGGFIERNAVGARQALLIAWLKERDSYGRFRALSPMASRRLGQHTHVHAKVLVADDTCFSVGSANLNSRSFGYDTEVNLVIDTRVDSTRADLRAAIAWARDDLLAEHLDVSLDAWRASLASAGGSLVAGIECSQGRDRTLVPATTSISLVGRLLARFVALVDPERPLPYDDLADSLMEASRSGPPAARAPIGLITLLVGLVGLVLAWRTTSLGAWLEPSRVAALGEALWSAPYGPLATIGAVFIATTFLVPVNLLTIAFAVTLPPWPAVVTTFTGSILSAVATYALGRRLGAASTERMLGKRFAVLDLPRRLANTGLFAIVLVRVLPLAPFTIMNIACGAFRIPFVNYALGTAIALIPGKVAVLFFASSLREWALHPKEFLANPWMWMAVGVVVILGIIYLRMLKSDRWKHPASAPRTAECDRKARSKVFP